MRYLALTIALLAGCETMASHPIASAVSVGTAMFAGGVAMALDSHPLAGGTMIGLSIGMFAVSVPIAIVIDNFNEAHRTH